MLFRKQTYGILTDYHSSMQRNVEIENLRFQNYGLLLKVQIIVKEELEYISLMGLDLTRKWERMAEHVRGPDLQNGEKTYVCDFEEVGGIFLQSTVGCAILSVVPKNRKYEDNQPVPVRGTLYMLRGTVMSEGTPTPRSATPNKG